MKARECMVWPVTTMAAAAPVEECARALATGAHAYLPVVDRVGRLIGMVDAAQVSEEGELSESGHWLPRMPRARPHTARQLMRPPTTCYGDDPLKLALERLLTDPARVLVVVQPRGRPEGVISETDIMRLAARILPTDFALGDLQSDLVTIGAEAELAVALLLLDAHNLRHLLVTEGDRFLSVIHRRDVEAHPTDRRDRDLVGDIMPLTGVSRAPVGTTMGQAVRRMVEDGVNALPLIHSDGRVGDIISTTDIIYTLIDLLARDAGAS